jgi:hypothetical protein
VALLVALLVAVGLAQARPAAAQAPLRATLAFKDPLPGFAFPEGSAIGLVVRIENPSGSPVLTGAGFSTTEFWRRLYFTDPLGRILINTGEAPVHREIRPFQCLSRSGVLQPTAVPAVAVEVLEASLFLEYAIDDARAFFDLGRPGHYTVSARVPLQVFTGGDLITDCDQAEGQTLVNVGTGTSAIPFILESNTLEFVIVNTGTGANVVVEPVDALTGGTPVTLVFDSITTAGATTLETSSAGPPPPAGFSLGNPPVFYSIQTGAVFSGQVQVCIRYDEGSFGSEDELRLFHFEGGGWQDVTDAGSPDTATNVLCGHVTALSPFAAFQTEPSTPAIRFGGFLPPLVEGGVYQGRRTIPVKFQLFDASNQPVATATPRFRAVGPGGAQVTGQFKFDARTQQYQFNFATRGLASGAWRLEAILDDGAVHAIQIQLQ